MARTRLTYVKIQELAYVLRDIFRYIKSWETKGFENLIKYPQIPSVLSENLAIHELERGLIPELKDYTFRHGGKKSDLIAQKLLDPIEILIEVKASGDKSFIEVRPKDVEANFIVWFCFESFFKNQKSNQIDVYVIPNPKQNSLTAGRIIKSTVLKKVTNINTYKTELIPTWSKIEI